jgi:signal transduction histidine kinase
MTRMGDQPHADSIGASHVAVGTREEIQNAIARAKQDWESTADTLPHVVCLLDGQRRAVRVNRVIEAWHLGRVNEVMGRDMHELLHPKGCAADCRLGRSLDDSWGRLQEGLFAEFELFDAWLERAVSVALRPVSADPNGRRLDGHTRAVMIVYDVTPLHAARAALVSLNESLEARVRVRTRELESANRDLQNEVMRRESAEDALRLSRNELELLSQQLIKAQESERHRIAQELHDSIGQSLSAIKYSLERATELHRQGRHTDTHPLLIRTVERVQETISEIRAIAMNLRPSILDDLGVASALAWLCREFGETYPLIGVHARISAEDADIPNRLATTVFRCTQELLNNVAKHGKASHVSVALAREPSVVTLIVHDDGVGLPSVSSSGSFGPGHGIRNLRERTQMTGGKLTLGSEPGCGTRARIDWVLTPSESVTTDEPIRPDDQLK